MIFIGLHPHGLRVGNYFSSQGLRSRSATRIDPGGLGFSPASCAGTTAPCSRKQAAQAKALDCGTLEKH